MPAGCWELIHTKVLGRCARTGTCEVASHQCGRHKSRGTEIVGGCESITLAHPASSAIMPWRGEPCSKVKRREAHGRGTERRPPPSAEPTPRHRTQAAARTARPTHRCPLHRTRTQRPRPRRPEASAPFGAPRSLALPSPTPPHDDHHMVVHDPDLVRPQRDLGVRQAATGRDVELQPVPGADDDLTVHHPLRLPVGGCAGRERPRRTPRA